MVLAGTLLDKTDRVHRKNKIGCRGWMMPIKQFHNMRENKWIEYFDFMFFRAEMVYFDMNGAVRNATTRESMAGIVNTGQTFPLMKVLKWEENLNNSIL